MVIKRANKIIVLRCIVILLCALVNSKSPTLAVNQDFVGLTFAHADELYTTRVI
jgi:hypothetical protein